MWVPALLGGMGGVGCNEAIEPAQVELPVRLDASGMEPVTTNLGYQVELSEARVAVRDFGFTIAGEAHASAGLKRAYEVAWNLLLPDAYAHPGHYQGGSVTGELRGDFLLDWLGKEGGELGVATLLEGDYMAVNMRLARADESMGVTPQDPLFGHTALFRGRATRDTKTIDFSILVDSPLDRDIVGVPFEARLKPDAKGQILFRLLPLDPYENDTLFDDLDFAELPTDAEGRVHINPDGPAVSDAYFKFRRTFQTHDHYQMSFQAQ